MIKSETGKEAIIISRNIETDRIKPSVEERVKTIERNLEKRYNTIEERESLQILKELINNY